MGYLLKGEVYDVDFGIPVRLCVLVQGASEADGEVS
jgi:hypothetical protein